MPRYHTSSSSSGSSHESTRSNASTRTYQTDATAYSSHTFDLKRDGQYLPSDREHTSSTRTKKLPSPHDSVETYASTADLDQDNKTKPSGPVVKDRYQCYAPDAISATSKEFAALFPSTRRLLIQHDESTADGNMNLRIDTEVTTSKKRSKQLTLFHLRMKDLVERNFSLRRYCRESGREVACCKKKYVRSTLSLPSPNQSKHPSRNSLEDGFQRPSHEPAKHRRQDSGYKSSDDDDDQRMEETLKILTAPSEEIISRPTNAIQLEFSNYAQVSLARIKTRDVKGYEFEYWGDVYFWRCEKHSDNGEIIVSYNLINQSTNQKVAIIMPDALSPQEEKWESRQGGWVPASSMRILRSGISDDLGDVIVATGLIALTDNSLRQHFHGIDRK